MELQIRMMDFGEARIIRRDLVVEILRSISVDHSTTIRFEEAVIIPAIRDLRGAAIVGTWTL